MVYKSLSTGGRPRRVGLFLSERSEYALRVREGALRYLSDHPGVELRDFLDDVTRPGREPDLLGRRPPWEAWGPDGLLAILPHHPAAVPWAQSSGVPVVALGCDFADDLPAVYVSPDSIAETAADHLAAAGYDHFGFVGVRGVVSVDRRRRVFAEAVVARGAGLASYDLETNPWPGLHELEERAAAEPGLIRFLASAPRPLGILAASDHVGRVVCVACERLGLGVPSDVGVLGIDDYAVARTSLPPLSSIHTPGEDVGYEAMALLGRLMAGGRPGATRGPTRLAVPATTIVARQSTGAAGGRESEVVRALGLIRRRACERIGVEEILDDLTVSRSTLERAFARRFGRTPAQELVRVRMERARQLLRETDLPVSQVAAMTGYERSSSFSEFFRKHAGQTPRAYRLAAAGPGGPARTPRRRTACPT